MLFSTDFTINDAIFGLAVLVDLDAVISSAILTRCNVGTAGGFSFEHLQLTAAPVFYQLVTVAGIRVHPVRHKCSDHPELVLFILYKDVFNRLNHFPLSIQAELANFRNIIFSQQQVLVIDIAFVQ